MKAFQSSSISFTALYTSQVWQHNGMEIPGAGHREGQTLYKILSPLDRLISKISGDSVRTFLLQRHHIINHLLDTSIQKDNTTQVLEIASGMSPRGYRFKLQYPNIHYVESDLPAIAERKRQLQLGAEQQATNHQVIDLDIFSTADDSLEVLIREQFDPTQPIVVITEGLVNYFPLSDMTYFWKRLRTALSDFTEARYLTDTYLPPDSLTLQGISWSFTKLLGLVSRSQACIHFKDDIEAKDHFSALGFNNIKVRDPRDYYLRLPIPKSRNVPIVRVIEASI